MKPTLNINIINIMRGKNRAKENQAPVIAPEIKAVFLRAMLKGGEMSKGDIRRESTGISVNLTAVCVRYFTRNNMLKHHESKHVRHTRYSLIDETKALKLAKEYEAQVKESSASKARRFITSEVESNGVLSRSDLISRTDFTVSTIDQALIRLVKDGQLRKGKDGREAIYRPAA